MRQHLVSLEFVFGSVTRAAVSFLSVGVGSALTIYSLAEGSLPKEWRMAELPAWLGPAVLVGVLAYGYRTLYFACHRLLLASSQPLVPARSDGTSIELRPGYARLDGSPSPEQIRAAGEVAVAPTFVLAEAAQRPALHPVAVPPSIPRRAPGSDGNSPGQKAVMATIKRLLKTSSTDTADVVLKPHSSGPLAGIVELPTTTDESLRTAAH
jgi:hypothetical protein